MPVIHTQKQSPDSLREIAKVLEDTADNLRAVAKSVEVHGWAYLEVTRDGERKSAIKKSERYSAAARDALRERLEAEGKFRAAEKE